MAPKEQEASEVVARASRAGGPAQAREQPQASREAGRRWRRRPKRGQEVRWLRFHGEQHYLPRLRAPLGSGAQGALGEEE